MAEEKNVYYPGSSFSSALPFPRGYNQPTPGFSEWQLDPKDVLELIEHALRGEYWDSNEKCWITSTHQTTVIKQVEKFDPVLQKKVTHDIRVPSGITSEKAKKIKALLNEDGIQDILRDISSRVHRVIIMSNWTERQLSDWLWDLGHDLAAKLFMYRVVWDVKSLTDQDTIHNLVMLISDACLRRAFLEGERRRLYEATKTTEQIVYDREQQKRGILSGIPIIGGLGK